MAFIAGAYTVTWNSVTIGQVSDGIRLRQSNSVEVIKGQSLGESTQDGVYQGGDAFIQLESLEYITGAIAAWWPYGDLGVVGLPGRLLTSLAKSLVLTAVSGTPAESSPATLTASKAILAPNQNLELLFATRLRRVPLMFQLLPYTSGDNSVWYTTT